jgi:hypothetical protein
MGSIVAEIGLCGRANASRIDRLSVRGVFPVESHAYRLSRILCVLLAKTESGTFELIAQVYGKMHPN